MADLFNRVVGKAGAGGSLFDRVMQADDGSEAWRTARDKALGAFGSDALTPSPKVDLGREQARGRGQDAANEARYFNRSMTPDEESRFLAEKPLTGDHYAREARALAMRDRFEQDFGGDDWATIGRKTLENFGPSLRQALGAGITEAYESARLAGLPSGTVPLQGGGYANLRQMVQDDLDKRFAAKSLPGQGLYDWASKDLAENAIDPGSSHLKEIAKVVADSAPAMIAGIVAGFATKNPVTGLEIGSAVGAAPQGTIQYMESRGEGRSTDLSNLDSAVNAISEYFGNRIELGMLMKPGGKFLPRLFKNAGAEAISEGLTQTVQSLYDKGVIHPDTPWSEVGKQILLAAEAGGAMGAGFSGAIDTARAGRDAIRGATAPLNTPKIEGLDLTGRPALDAAIVAAAQPTQADIASPLDTSDIVAGKAEIARTSAQSMLDDAAKGAGLPTVGQRVEIQTPEGQDNLTGTLREIFGDAGDQGLNIELDTGGSYREYLNDIRDAGHTVVPIGTGAKPGTPGAGLKRLIRASESSGNDQAQNPLSSASGRYQFTSRTFVDTYKQVFGDSESDAEILAKKNDPAIQEKLMDRLLANNGRALSKAGFEASDGNLYLAHVLGAQGAINALRNPEASAREVLGDKVVNANPFMRDMTAGDVAAWAERRVGGKEATPAPRFADTGTPADTGTDFLNVELNSTKIGGEDDADAGGNTPSPGDLGAGGGVSAPGSVSIEDTPSGKGIVVAGLNEDQKSAIVAAIPNITASAGKDGALVFSKKHESRIRQVLDEARAGASDGVRVAPGADQVSAATRPQRALDQARDLVVSTQNASTSFVGRKLGIPMSQAESLLTNLEKEGVVSAVDKRTAKRVVLQESSSTPAGDGTRAAPIEATEASHVDQAAANVAAPTEAQKEAGNYQKGHVRVQGLDITIETPKGAERSGVDPNGKPWSVNMPDHYGYVKRTEGADGDHVDVYVGPNPKSDRVFVVDQVDAKTGKFDEHKAMLGYDSEAGALAAYDAAFSDGKGAQRRKAVSEVSADEFKAWLNDGNTRKPFAVEKTVNRRRSGAASGPEDMASFIASMGGIADTEGHDLKGGRGLGDVFIPGYGKLVRKNGGKTIDEIGEALHEAGFFGPASATERPTTADVLEKIDELTRRKIYRPEDQAEIDAKANGEEQEQERQARADEIEARFGELGVPLVPAELDDVLALVAKGLSVEEAVDQWLMSEASLAFEEARKELGYAPEYDFDFPPIGATDEQSGQDERGADQADEAGERSAGEQGRASAGEEAAAGRGEASGATEGQLDAFGTRREDQRKQLEREAEGRAKAKAPQKAPGSDGGLFDDNSGRTDDLFSGRSRAPEKSDTSGDAFQASSPAGNTATSAGAPAPAPSPKPSGYGSKNKLVTADRAAEVRKRLQDKLRNQLNSGIDPEILALGTELAVFHIEAGVRKFADFVKTISDDLGMTPAQLKRNLRAWYVGAQAMLEDSGEDVADMDGPGAVKAAIAMIEDQPTAPAPAPAPAAKPAKAGKDKGATRLRDWTGVEIPNYAEQAQRGDFDGGPTKEAFLKDAKTYLRAVEAVLAERGWTAGTDRRGKPAKAVSVNEAGPAVSGDVSLSMFMPDGRGAYANINTTLAGPNGGITLLAREATVNDRYGARGGINQWWPVDLTAQELADRLVRLAEGANERITRSQETSRGDQGSLRDGDAGAGARDVQPAPQDRSSGRASEQDRAPGERDDRQPVSGRTDAAERTDPRSGETPGDRGTGARSADRVSPDGPVTGHNWRIEPGALDESRSPAQKARDNLRAIEIVKQIEAEGRPATRDEQEALAKYVGWGGLKNAFADDAKGFETIASRLKELLTEDEYETARRSVQYAHYTSEKVIRPMWDAAKRLGFAGGKVFEPGMGTGNFLGMMPAELAANSQYQGLEFDGITAAIAKALYPESGVSHADYTKTPMPKDQFDLVIGNPPFAETAIRSDPEYGKLGFLIHDFFFAKSLDSVRPGGLLMFVTSAGTMNKIDTKAREFLADRADLVGAVRLPGDAFKENAGTEVTTDILVFRKRVPGEAAQSRDWIESVPVRIPGRDGVPVALNTSSYFEAHPEQRLGEPVVDHLVAGVRYGVKARPGADLSTELRQALTRLPENVMTPWDASEARFDAIFGAGRKEGEFFLQDGRLFQHSGNVGVPVQQRGKGVSGGIPAKDQERIRALIPVKDALRSVYAADMADNKAEGDKARKALNQSYDRFVQQFGPINKAEISYRRPTVIQQESARAAAREEIRLQGGFFDEGSFDPAPLIDRGAKLAEIAQARKAAKEAAEAKGEKWDEGSFDPADMPDLVIVKRPNVDPFMDDPEGYRLRAIEHYDDETGEAKKSNVFFENILTKEKAPEINSANDALLYVLNKVGRPDLDLIAAQAGMSRTDVLAELGDAVFEVPGEGAYQTREQYLSGNVRQKLVEAKEAAERNPAFERNVRALEDAQPPLLGPADISANLGMPWIPPAVIEDFGKSALGLSSLTARYRPKLAQWSVDGDRHSAAARSTWGTSDMDAVTILSAALNRTQIKVTKKVRVEGRDQEVVDPEATQAAQDKAQQMKARFAEWVWSDPKRADDLTALYNRDYNNLVAPTYDGSYLTTPGIASHWKWRPHQTRVIARIIQAGNTYMAHGVGAGKTSAMIGAGMEMRRLGLVRKPMYVVPNHMLGQFTKEFYEQYPTAKIMIADERQFHTDRRKQFIANAGASDLDAIIITHSAFGFIPLSDEYMDTLIQRQIDDFRDILNEAKAELKAGEGRGDRFTVRRIEQQIESLQQRLSGRFAGKRRDQVFTFEEMGVDFLFVDEAHLFRKLDFATKMGSVRGIDPNGSQASYDLFAKTRYLEDRNPGRSHVLASGTPVTNTMAELYTLSRYLQPQELAARGLSAFDAWAGAFGDTVTALEQDPAGGYKPQTRFAKFMNVPELSAMVRQIMDVVTSKQLEQYVVRPQIKGGKRRMVLAQPTDALESFQGQLERRMEAIQRRSGPPQKGDDILLSVIGDGRKAAIDMRLVDPSLPKDTGSKLELMIANVAKIANETKRQPFHRAGKDGYEAKPYAHGPATQMIFSDLGINGEFPIHKYIKAELIRRGLKPDQVAIISDYKTHVARQRLFNDMNEGKVRVLIGSVPKMGTGVNAQKRLYAIHNLDPQWYPANDEQRNGRGIRQGNENPEIEIVDYSTKGTYDSTMWQMMETKARFIEGFFNGDPTLRSMEDLGEASQYEQAKAITTADPRIMELTQYRQDLEKALLRRAAFEREQYALREKVRSAEDLAERMEKRIPRIEADIAARQDIAGDAFTGTVMGKSFDKRVEFGQAVLDRLEELAQGVAKRDIPVGEIGGFKLTADVSRMGRDNFVALYLNFSYGQQEVRADTPEGIPASIANALRKLEGKRDDALAAKERAEREIAEFTPELGKRYQGGAEIDALQEQVNTLETQLTREAEARAQRRSGQPEAPQQRVATNNVDGARGPIDFDQAKAELRDALRKLDPMGRINLNVIDRAFPEKQYKNTAGLYWPGARLIEVVVNHEKGATNEYWTLHHEAVHAFRDMGLWTQAEWSALVEAATKDQKKMAEVRKRWAQLDLTEEGFQEEAVAELFGEYAAWEAEFNGKTTPTWLRALGKAVTFLSGLLRVIRGKTWTPIAYRIMDQALSGEIGSRPAARAVFGRKPFQEDGPAEAPLQSVIAATPDEATVADLTERAKGLLGDIRGKWDDFRTAMQDRMLPVLRTQAAAEQVLGRALHWHENPYMAEELMTGRVGAQLDQLEKGYVAPLFDAMKADKISAAELESYLYAKHAAERNAAIDKINPELNGRGSGMSDVEAQAILNRIEDEGRTAAFERAAAHVWNMLKFARDLKADAGLLSEEQLTAWEQTYQHYVPLKGFEELDGVDARPNRGSGISVRGQESKRAFGRRSQAKDILAHAIMQAEEAIIRAQKNEVARKLYNLAKAAPDDEFWKLNKVTHKRRLNPETGLVEYYFDRNLQPEDADYTISLKIDGKEKRVTLNKANPAAVRVAEAMRRLNEGQADKAVRMLGAVNRWLSHVNTTLNPEFVISNAFRDLQEGAINLQAEDVRGLARGVLKDYFPAMYAATKGAFGRETGRWGQWYQEFVEDGGKIAFNQLQDLSSLQARLEREVKAMQAKALSPGTMALHAKGALKAFFNTVENVNSGVENGIRLATYKNAREKGMTREQAASLAKNLTINFNRKGGSNWALILNSAYLFYNASVQGSARMVLAIGKSRRVQGIVATAVLTGFMLDALNRLLSPPDDDDEQYYDKIGEWEKEHNLILMQPGGKGRYWKLPLPYGYGTFFTVGRSMSELVHGKNPLQVGGHLVGAIVDAFNPVGGTQSLLNFIAPSVLDPVVDIVQNKDFAGRPIVPNQPDRNATVPNSQLYWSSTSPLWRSVSDTLNDVSGGDKVRPGAIDISPEVFEHLFGQVTGAAGQFYERPLNLAAKAFDPQAEITAGDIPFARKVVGGKPAWFDRSLFYARIQSVEQATHDLKAYAKQGDVEGLKAFVGDERDKLVLGRLARQSRKALGDLRKAQKALDTERDKGGLDKADYNARTRQLKDVQERIIVNFNKTWNDRLGVNEE